MKSSKIVIAREIHLMMNLLGIPQENYSQLIKSIGDIYETHEYLAELIGAN
jgi:hypothetical protein